MTLAISLDLMVEILVANLIDSIKRSLSKHLAGHICPYYMELPPSLPFLSGFALQSLMVVLLHQLLIT